MVISASAGIETITRKMAELVAGADMPRIIVINKMDAENVIFGELIKNIQDTFGMQCRCANLPSADKASVIDCIENDSGESPLITLSMPIPSLSRA